MSWRSPPGGRTGPESGSGSRSTRPNAPERARSEPPKRAAARAERGQGTAQGQAERAAGNGSGNGRCSGDGFTFVLPPLPPLPIDGDAIVYDAARQAIENSQYRSRHSQPRSRAGRSAQNAARDAALYWKAYSQSKLDLDKEALQTITELSKQFAKSTWVKDAKALAVEIQPANGQPISAELQNDEELKLLALRGVMQTDPDKGVPIIEKMLAGGATPRVRDRALFVLSQSRSPRARDIIAQHGEEQRQPRSAAIRAIRYLGMMGGADDREALNGIYRSATDVSVKRAILQSYFQSGNVDRIDRDRQDGERSRPAAHRHPQPRR